MSQAKIDILQRALEREKAARKSAEEILDEKERYECFKFKMAAFFVKNCKIT